jgi:DNA-binding MarR family transcriptional regulator
MTKLRNNLLASLWWMQEHGGPPTQAQLAGQAGTDLMMTSQVLRRLEGRGLLARDPDPGDSRDQDRFGRALRTLSTAE